jgi:hypothetical protein
MTVDEETGVAIAADALTKSFAGSFFAQLPEAPADGET